MTISGGHVCRFAQTAVEGDMENGSILAGQVAALVKKRGRPRSSSPGIMAEPRRSVRLTSPPWPSSTPAGRCLEDADA